MHKPSFSNQILLPATRAMLLSASLLVTTLSGSAFAQDTPAKEAGSAPAAKSTKKAEPDEKEASPASGEEAEAKVTPAPSPPTEEEIESARLAFEAGTKAYEEGKYEAAVTEFEAAHKTIPSPHAEYWRASALDKGDTDHKKTAEVVAAYEKFLSNSGASHVGADKVADAKSRLAELKKLLPAAIKFVTQPAGASVIVDGKPLEGVTPLDVELKSGTHKVEITLEGHETASIELNAQGGSQIEQQVTLKALAVPPAPVVISEEPSPKESSIVPAAVTLGIAGAGLITGTIFGIMALNSKSDFDDDPTIENADAAERNALIADMSFGIAITLGITGVVLLTANDSDETQAKVRQQPRLVVAPYGGRDGGGATARLTF